MPTTETNPEMIAVDAIADQVRKDLASEKVTISSGKIRNILLAYQSTKLKAKDKAIEDLQTLVETQNAAIKNQTEQIRRFQDKIDRLQSTTR